MVLPVLCCARTGVANAAPTAKATAVFLFIPPAPPDVVSLYGTSSSVCRTPRMQATSQPRRLSTMAHCFVSRTQHFGALPAVLVELVAARLKRAADLPVD